MTHDELFPKVLTSTQDASFNQQYELALKIGEKRFGSECKHEKTKNGYCLNCLRRVVDRLPGRG